MEALSLTLLPFHPFLFLPTFFHITLFGCFFISPSRFFSYKTKRRAMPSFFPLSPLYSAVLVRSIEIGKRRELWVIEYVSRVIPLFLFGDWGSRVGVWSRCVAKCLKNNKKLP